MMLITHWNKCVFVKMSHPEFSAPVDGGSDDVGASLQSLGQECEDWPVQRVIYIINLSFLNFLINWSSSPTLSSEAWSSIYQHFKGHLLHLKLCKYFQCTLEKKTVKKFSPDTSCRKIPRYQIPIQQNTKVLLWQSRVEKYFGLLSRYFSRRRVESKCWFSNICYHYLCTWINFSERYARPRIVKFVQQRRYSPVFKYSSIQQFSNIQVFKTKCHRRFAETSNRTWSRTSRRRIAISSHKRIVGWRPSLCQGR